MTISDEIGRLGELHRSGVLSDDEFTRAKARVLSGAAPSAEPGIDAINSFRRSRSDHWLGGVCGGLAHVTGMAAWIWRLIFASLMLCAGSGGLLYLLLWILVPREPAYFDGRASGLHPG